MALPFATCSNAKLSKRDFALSQPQKQQRQTNTNTATKQTKKIKFLSTPALIILVKFD